MTCLVSLLSLSTTVDCDAVWLSCPHHSQISTDWQWFLSLQTPHWRPGRLTTYYVYPTLQNYITTALDISGCEAVRLYVRLWGYEVVRLWWALQCSLRLINILLHTKTSVKHSLIVSSLKNTTTTPGGPGRMSLLFISAAALGDIIVTFPGPQYPTQPQYIIISLELYFRVGTS